MRHTHTHTHTHTYTAMPSTTAHDHPRAFVSAEYDPGHTGIEVWDAGGGSGGGDGAADGGAWRSATVYMHRGTGSLVLWFGGDEYEGIGGSYRWCPGGRCAKVAGAPCGPRLLDSDGDVVPTRAVPSKEVGAGAHMLRGTGGSAAPVQPAQAGTGAGRFLPFGEALAFVRSLRLKNKAEWYAWKRTGARPPNIPSGPETVYKHAGWQGCGHWLGTGAVASANKVFLPFEEALLFVRSLRLKCRAEWEAWKRTGARPANVPGNPDKTYRHTGWQGYGHWLGTGTVATFNRVFLPFEEALVFVRSLRLKSAAEWKAWSKSGLRPANIPGTPDQCYRHVGWQGYGHWLGTGAVAT